MQGAIGVVICALLVISAADGFNTRVLSNFGVRRMSMAFKQQTTSSTISVQMGKGDADILVRAYRGEKVERTPVWLMRQVLTMMILSTTKLNNYNHMYIKAPVTKQLSYSFL